MKFREDVPPKLARATADTITGINSLVVQVEKDRTYRATLFVNAKRIVENNDADGAMELARFILKERGHD